HSDGAAIVAVVGDRVVALVSTARAAHGDRGKSLSRDGAQRPRLDLLEALFSEIDRGRLLPARLDRARAPKQPDARRPGRDPDEGGRDQDLGEREAPRAAEQARGARSFSDGGQSSHNSDEPSAENVPTPPGVRRAGFSIGSRAGARLAERRRSRSSGSSTS